MGPLSDIIGRRAGLILCSMITLLGALLSTFAWSEDVLIAARIVTGSLGDLVKSKMEIPQASEKI